MTKSEDKVHIDIILNPRWANIITSGEFMLSYYPMPGFPKNIIQPHAAIDLFVKQQAEKNLDIPDSVVLGEN